MDDTPLQERLQEVEVRGQLVFESDTETDFESLVEQTLEQSEFIEVENDIIYEVVDE